MEPIHTIISLKASSFDSHHSLPMQSLKSSFTSLDSAHMTPTSTPGKKQPFSGIKDSFPARTSSPSTKNIIPSIKTARGMMGSNLRIFRNPSPASMISRNRISIVSEKQKTKLFSKFGSEVFPLTSIFLSPSQKYLLVFNITLEKYSVISLEEQKVIKVGSATSVCWCSWRDQFATIEKGQITQLFPEREIPSMDDTS
eukprot:TRINITY_DN9594_c1_g1_i2.p1 TRINITY_DN9594_c1_g1~~TRINITY_DN9594_c1_g1_i2.p1  ORF type:complete len:198 (+),score=36.68 TRINITY_DN9594_c1_g1_i2:1683-2276(+)